MLHVCPLALALVLAACGSTTPTGPAPSDSGDSGGSGSSGVATAVAVTCTPDTTGHQCRASAQMSSGAAQDVTTSATWTSSNAAVATVDNAGRVTHIGSGQTEIRATYQNLLGGAIILVNVSRTVASVTVACTAETGAHVCTATAHLSDGTTEDVTRAGAVWSSSNTNIATVDSRGRVTHRGNGQVEIAALFQYAVGGVVLTVSGVVKVTSVSVTCAPQIEADQCTAVANFDDGTSENITSRATWTSSNTAVATVDSSGRVRRRSTGQVEIKATYQGREGSIGLDIVVSDLTGASVVINEFATRGGGFNEGATTDWVELRNDSNNPVDISGWEIRDWRTSGTISVTFKAGAGLVLAPGCHYLTANHSDVGGVVRDARLENLNNEGGLALVRADGSIADQVGYDPNSPFREGATLPSMKPDDSRSYSRSGNDTNDNAADFVLKSRSPLNSASSCAIR